MHLSRPQILVCQSSTTQARSSLTLWAVPTMLLQRYVITYYVSLAPGQPDRHLWHFATLSLQLFMPWM